MRLWFVLVASAASLRLPAASRRQFAARCGFGSLGALATARAGGARPARADSGLIQLPLRRPLSNRYFLLRAGESANDEADVLSTSPATKLDASNFLTARGEAQALAAADALAEHVSATESRRSWGTPCRTVGTRRSRSDLKIERH